VISNGFRWHAHCFRSRAMSERVTEYLRAESRAAAHEGGAAALDEE
jgi:hypothetical protein